MNSALEEVSEEKGAAFGKLFSHQENSLDPIVSEHKATQSEEITVDTNTQKSAEPEEPPEASPEKPQRKRPICQDCGYKTMMMSTLEKHKCVPIKCEKCDFETKNEAHLRRHKIKLHVKKDGMFCCDECPFKSLRDFNLKKHRENKHRNLKQYPKMTLK